jgi:metal transporter CNNM
MTYFIVIILVVLSGIFSGLTLGLLSLDKAELERKIALGNKDAKRVYSVRRRGNLLLCTLLIGNVAVNSTLAIFLGSIASGFIAGLVATGLIVIFGEIIPQATFSRYALKVGAKTAWLVKIFIIVFFVICYPIAWVLDKVLGDEMTTIYSKKELMKIVEEHRSAKESDIDEDENRIISGALSYSDKTAEQIMTPRVVIFALEEKTRIDHRLLEKIKHKGFTRIPVYRGSIDEVVGILYVKDLIGLEMGTKVGNICRRKVQQVEKDILLDDLLNKFIKTKTHLALVIGEYGGMSGVVTLEDVIEEVLRREIVDEDDQAVDMQKLAAKRPHRG